MLIQSEGITGMGDTGSDSIHSAWPCISGDENGNLYVVWYDFKYGSVDGWHGSVILRKSMDGGRLWGSEQIITPLPTAIGPRISVQDSIIAVAWNDFVDYDNDGTLLRISHDAGTSWDDTVAINSLGKAVDITLGGTGIFLGWWHARDIYFRSGRLSVGCFPRAIPETFLLSQNYPNPFNVGTVIGYGLQRGHHRVSITIYNTLGQVVTKLMEGEEQEGGYYQTGWSASRVPSGVYFYRMSVGGFSTTKKMIVIK